MELRSADWFDVDVAVKTNMKHKAEKLCCRRRLFET